MQIIFYMNFNFRLYWREICKAGRDNYNQTVLNQMQFKQLYKNNTSHRRFLILMNLTKVRYVHILHKRLWHMQHNISLKMYFQKLLLCFRIFKTCIAFTVWCRRWVSSWVCLSCASVCACVREKRWDTHKTINWTREKKRRIERKEARNIIKEWEWRWSQWCYSGFSDSANVIGN